MTCEFTCQDAPGNGEFLQDRARPKWKKAFCKWLQKHCGCLALTFEDEIVWEVFDDKKRSEVGLLAPFESFSDDEFDEVRDMLQDALEAFENVLLTSVHWDDYVEQSVEQTERK